MTLTLKLFSGFVASVSKCESYGDGGSEVVVGVKGQTPATDRGDGDGTRGGKVCCTHVVESIHRIAFLSATFQMGSVDNIMLYTQLQCLSSI